MVSPNMKVFLGGQALERWMGLLRPFKIGGIGRMIPFPEMDVNLCPRACFGVRETNAL